MIYKDWLGNPFEVGSPVLYAISEGHFAKVVWGEVLEIIPCKPDGYFGGFRNFKLKVQPYYENVDVIGKGGSSARSIDYAWDDQTDLPFGERKLIFTRVLPKPAFIKNVEKVTVFPLPEGARERFEAQLDAAVAERNSR